VQNAHRANDYARTVQGSRIGHERTVWGRIFECHDLQSRRRIRNILAQRLADQASYRWLQPM
jgi:hypothetical protein